MNRLNTNNLCCPEFDPGPWENKLMEWSDKPFVRGKVCTFFFIPIGFGKVITRMNERIKKEGNRILDNLCLSDHTSRWNMDVYLAVDKPVPGADNIGLTGKFLSRVYEGDFKDTGKWCRDFTTYAKDNGYSIKKWYMWYTTCPKCAKKYGKNYVVVICEIL